MAMKRTEIEKRKGLALREQMKKAGAPDRFGRESAAPISRREQRELERAKGLVPFAVKIDGELVRQVRELAERRQADLNEVVAELLTKALEKEAK